MASNRHSRLPDKFRHPDGSGGFGDPVAAGQLDKRVIVQTATPTANAFGEAVVTWADTATVWAAIATVGGGETWQANQLVGEADHKVTMRYRALTNKQRLKFGTRVFEITWINNPGERNERLEVYCTEQKS